MVISSNSKNTQDFYVSEGSKIDDECCELLSKCELPHLNSFMLIKCSISNIGIPLIFKANWQELQSLNLSILLNNLCPGDYNEQFLSKINKQKFSSLNFLNIQKCRVSGRYLFDLNSNVGWENLKQLSMGSQQVSKEQVSLGFSNICQYHLPNLAKLLISDFYLSKNSVKQFTKARWNNISNLKLYKCMLETESAMILSKCKWKFLYYLNLQNNHIADCSIDSLSSANWSQIFYINLSMNKVMLAKNEKTILGIMNVIKLGVKEVRLEFNWRMPKIIQKLIKTEFPWYND